MSTIRFFSGGRDYGKGKTSIASQMMRRELMKKGKSSSAERFKAIARQKLEENKKNAMFNAKPFSLPGAKTHVRRMSKHAERMLKEMAEKKAAKKAKEERKSVVVQQRMFSNGSIIKNGKIFDIAGNNVARVNTKNGKIHLTAGMGGLLGMYKPKSMMTNFIIQDAINKYSPYYINLRKMQEMQAGAGVWGAPAEVINIYGRAPVVHDHAEHSHLSQGDSGVFGDFSSDQAGPRQNVGSTAWGAVSDNVWGTYTDNIWGTSSDTVWGTNTSDVWGGIGGNPWGNLAKTHRVWGSGGGHNYLAGLAARVAAFFGLHFQSQAARAALHEAVTTRASGSGGAHEHGQTTRASAAHDAHEHAAVTTRAPIITSKR